MLRPVVPRPRCSSRHQDDETGAFAFVDFPQRGMAVAVAGLAAGSIGVATAAVRVASAQVAKRQRLGESVAVKERLDHSSCRRNLGFARRDK